MKPPAITDQWIDTDPDSVSEIHLGPGQAIVNEDVESFTDAWLRVDVIYHETKLDDFFGGPAILSGWDEATAYYVVIFFEDPLIVLPEHVTLFLALPTTAIRGLPPSDKQMGLEFTAHVLPTPPYNTITYSHGSVETDNHPAIMKLEPDPKGSLVTMFQS